MRVYTVYLPNGQIDRTGMCSDADFVHNIREDDLFIEALANPQLQYVDNGQLVDMPPQPSMNHVFDYDAKSWVFDTKSASAKAYLQRNQLLQDGPDRINPIWWNSMTAEQQQAWTTYRQSLLDVPQQPGFPEQIDWPAKPQV